MVSVNSSKLECSAAAAVFLVENSVIASKKCFEEFQTKFALGFSRSTNLGCLKGTDYIKSALKWRLKPWKLGNLASLATTMQLL